MFNKEFNKEQGLKGICTGRLILFAFGVLIYFATSAGSIRIAAQMVTNSLPPIASPTPFVNPTPLVTPTPYPAQMQPPSTVAPLQQTNFTSGASFTSPTNYLKNSAAFRQEIARMEITVVRAGKAPMSITQVPRVQSGDVIKVRMLDEAVGGIKPDQSNWNWTFLVAFVNPNRNNDKQKSVSEEINFRKSGWYKEYSFIVPYDSQPVFFLYPKPKYRGKILSVINKKPEEVRKLGEKTIEIAGAYAQINSFLNELQTVLVQTQSSRYGNFVTYPNTTGGTIQKPYGIPGVINKNSNPPEPVYNYNALVEQTIERIARSFNINLPSCWQSANGGFNYGNYGSYNSGSFGGSYGNASNQNSFGYAVSSDLIGRAQCIAKNVRLEDFDISLASMLKQGGIFAATQLRDKYPQLAYWINIAAAALDFIVKVFQKSPLRIVPTIVSSSDNQSTGSYPNNGFQNNGFQNNYSSGAQNSSSPAVPVKISLYAESQPSEQGFITAYPIVVHKWQAEPDAEVISLYPPALSEPCLHVGQNILKNTNLSEDSAADTFSKDFKLVISGTNGFKKEFPLRKNLGLGGWELNLTREDINSFPKVQTMMEAFITGTRGFNEIKSPAFELPVPMSGTYEIKTESQKAFTVGGKRTITIRNASGNCRCLQAVVYKPSSGGQLVFETNAKDVKNQLLFSADGKEASFEIDASNFEPGQGTLEIKSYGGESNSLVLKLYPMPPEITDFKINAGDREGTIIGERLEQMQFVKINGRKAKLQPGKGANEKIAVFEEASAAQGSGNVSLELGIEGDRAYQVPKTFKAGLARPKIVADQANEIEAVFPGNKNIDSKMDLSKYSVIPIETREFTVNLQNPLTDYDFKTENLSIETRIEKSQAAINDAPKANFEVLDWKSMRVTLTLSEQVQKLLGGRRMQFKIRDKERGDSDWYSIKQTFVRIPIIVSVKCTNEMNGQCELKGDGIEYIQQISVDGGASWFPSESTGLIVQPSADGQKTALIPLLADKKMLRIKLRDYPKTEGLTVSDFVFSNTAKANKKLVDSTNQNPAFINPVQSGKSLVPNQHPAVQNQMPNGNRNQSSPMMNKPPMTNQKTND